MRYNWKKQGFKGFGRTGSMLKLKTGFQFMDGIGNNRFGAAELHHIKNRNIQYYFTTFTSNQEIKERLIQYAEYVKLPCWISCILSDVLWPDNVPMIHLPADKL